MSDGSYRQVHVKCPFYRRDDGKKRLSCEGVVDDCTLTWKFGRREDMVQQMNIFCCGCYEKCEVYRMLMENKYWEDSDG